METLFVSNAGTWVACGPYYGIAHRPQGCVWPFEKACVKVQPGILALLKYGRSCSEEMKKQQQQQQHTSKPKKISKKQQQQNIKRRKRKPSAFVNCHSKTLRSALKDNRRYKGNLQITSVKWKAPNRIN